jgi:hypothetical protein
MATRLKQAGPPVEYDANKLLPGGRYGQLAQAEGAPARRQRQSRTQALKALLAWVDEQTPPPFVPLEAFDRGKIYGSLEDFVAHECNTSLIVDHRLAFCELQTTA